MKTDLARILSISGQHGLFRYLAQARGGAIVEALSTNKRTVFNMKTRMTTLADISIYTTEEEVKLQDVFLKMREVLGEDAAPSSKDAPEVLKDFFSKALPDYDADRFYVSHMKKVVDWYNELREFASFDFVTEGDEDEEEGALEEVGEDETND